MRIQLSFIFILFLFLFPQFGNASNLALEIQKMSAQIQLTTDPQRRARMQRQMDKRMTPKFEQQMRNAQNNIHRSLGRMSKALTLGNITGAQMEIKTFEKHLARFEKLARAGNKLNQYRAVKFELKISRLRGARPGILNFRAAPAMKGAVPESYMKSSVKQLLSRYGFLASRAENTKVRMPPATKATKGRGVPRQAQDVLNSNLSPSAH